MMANMLIKYSRELRITNLDQLSHGTGCRYLIVVKSIRDGEYIAKKWSRKNPGNIGPGEIVVSF